MRAIGGHRQAALFLPTHKGALYRALHGKCTASELEQLQVCRCKNRHRAGTEEFIIVNKPGNYLACNSRRCPTFIHMTPGKPGKMTVYDWNEIGGSTCHHRAPFIHVTDS